MPEKIETGQKNTLSDIERGWIQGLIEGEGSLLVNTDKYGYLSFRLSIANNSLELLEEVKKLIGGYIITKKKDDGKAYELRIAGNTMQRLLPRMRFYTKEKEIRRVSFLKYMAIARKRNGHWAPGERDLALRELFTTIHLQGNHEWLFTAS
jgi:hypothetical protein